MQLGDDLPAAGPLSDPRARSSARRSAPTAAARSPPSWCAARTAAHRRPDATAPPRECITAAMRSLCARACSCVPRLAAADAAQAHARSGDREGARESAASRWRQRRPRCRRRARRRGRCRAAARGSRRTAFGTISPEIRCVERRLHARPRRQNFAFRFSGFFGSAQLDSRSRSTRSARSTHARAAARAGLDAQTRARRRGGR